MNWQKNIADKNLPVDKNSEYQLNSCNEKIVPKKLRFTDSAYNMGSLSSHKVKKFLILKNCREKFKQENWYSPM
jgi:hypothetical protein